MSLEINTRPCNKIILLQHINAWPWSCGMSRFIWGQYSFVLLWTWTHSKYTITWSRNSLRETICWLTFTKLGPKEIFEIFATGLQEYLRLKYFVISSKEIRVRFLSPKFWSSDKFYYSSVSGNESRKWSYGGTLKRYTGSFSFMTCRSCSFTVGKF